ncbi:MAG: NYN domain-containing protein [Rhodobacteraceae bacterium]|nr:NYN domain-containing protein [Paracoccaceae bacterium]
MIKKTVPEHNVGNDSPNVALLIDGENVPVSCAGQIFERSRKYGQLGVRRIYGGVPHIGGWEAFPGLRVMHSGSGKNAADMLLAIDAVSLSYEGTAQVFVLASSDRDFSHLALHLRERRYRVIGMGEEKAPTVFREACHEFFVLAVKKTPEQINKAVADLLREEGTMLLKLLGSRMRDRGFLVKDLPAASWSKYLASYDELFLMKGEGQQVSVKLKPTKKT